MDVRDTDAYDGATFRDFDFTGVRAAGDTAVILARATPKIA